jgi:hypothetical protein
MFRFGVDFGVVCGVSDAQRRELVSQRVELNHTIRVLQRVHGGIPLLANKRWARQWQAEHRRGVARELKQARAELADITRRIGPPPALFTPRPVGGRLGARLAAHMRALGRVRVTSLYGEETTAA